MKAGVTWKGDLRFDGSGPTRHPIPLDGDPTHAYGTSPMEAVLIALCGCTAMNVISILKKKREPIEELVVSAVSEEAAESPKVFTDIRVTYRVTGSISHKAMEDAIHLSESKYCPVAAMVSKTARIQSTIEYAD